MATSILITGGTGFLGSAILEALEEKHPEWTLSVLDLRKPSDHKAKVHYAIGDITQAAEVKAIIDDIRPTTIIHSAGFVPALASRYSREERDRVFAVNVGGTRTMLAAARSANVKAVVWTGSSTAVTDDVRFEYPNIDESWPTSNHSFIYGESKASSPIYNAPSKITDRLQDSRGRDCPCRQ